MPKVVTIKVRLVSLPRPLWKLARLLLDACRRFTQHTWPEGTFPSHVTFDVWLPEEEEQCS